MGRSNIVLVGSHAGTYELKSKKFGSKLTDTCNDVCGAKVAGNVGTVTENSGPLTVMAVIISGAVPLDVTCKP